MTKISYYIHNCGVGGAEEVVLNLIKYSDRNAIQPIFLTEGSSGPSLTLDALNQMGVPIYLTDGSVQAYQAVYAAEQPSIVHVLACGDIQNGYQGALNLGIHCVETPACVAYSTGWERYPNLVTAVYLCHAHWLAGGGGHDYFRTIDCGVDTQSIVNHPSKEDCKQRWGLDPKRPVVGWFGRFDFFKCPKAFLDIASFIREQMPNCQYIMFGDGIDRGYCEGISGQRGLQIKFTGFTKERGLAFGAMDVFAFPSIQEAFGLVMPEAMTCGTPIVTTDYPVMKEVCGEAAVYMENVRTDPLPPLVSRQYARAAVDIFTNPDKGDKMSKVGLDRAKHYSADRMAKEYADLYSEILNKPA